jgi:hypothetical protein
MRSIFGVEGADDRRLGIELNGDKHGAGSGLVVALSHSIRNPGPAQTGPACERAARCLPQRRDAKIDRRKIDAFDTLACSDFANGAPLIGASLR